MALRPQSTDFLHSMRFHVTADQGVGGGGDILQSSAGRAQAGFSSVGTPEASVEIAEYREGNFIYTRKFPGNPSMSDITMQRGVAATDTAFWNWLRVVIEGSGEYRTNLTVFQYHRQNVLSREFPANPANGNLTEFNTATATSSRYYSLYNAFPMRVKVASDLDATASEISIAEIDISYESFEIGP